MRAVRAETRARELFRDAAFPASDSSLFYNLSTPLAQFREDITWRRPQDICATPQLFPDNPWEGQVKQGLLGDCWFLCACAALQKSRHLLDQVFPPGQPGWSDQEYQGFFTCRIWQFGHWEEVTIDDRLPCLAGRLCFSRCQREDVFWLPLLEKAYAKVHGSYEHLWAGQVADALVDLTGSLAERWSLKDIRKASGQQDRPSGGEHRACQQLLRLKDQCLLSCSVLSPRAGARELGEFHAFIISDLQELRSQTGQGILLLRIHNPWGRRCWQGLWREGGEGWNQVEPAKESELLAQLQEGEFWVEEEEFLREFDEVTIGYPVTEAGHLQSLYTEKVLCHTRALPGAWVTGQSAGGCRNNSCFPCNPKFWLRLLEPSEVCVAVLQRPRRRLVGQTRALAGASPAPVNLPGKDYQAVGLHIWKVEKRKISLPRVLSAPPVAGTACHAYDREIHLRCELSPGYYLAVPSTFLKDVPGQFLLRVFSTGKISLSAVRLATKGASPGAALPAGEWETVQLQGSWRAGQTAGGSRNFASYPCNPCLPFSVPEGAGPRYIRITLQQHCRLSDSQLHPIGFHVFQVPADGEKQDACSLLLQEPLLSCVPHCYAQEVSRLCLLSAGNYRIVPSTYLPDTEGTFTVTIATRIDRQSIHSQEMLGQLLQEVSFMAVMKA
ncbi:calpain-10 [Rattus norvegicus]|uniref:Calpain-10 n=1 Tax=Rattus norvegicus TaxID=10116 RepID=CAN10_RAT|nr:calpain-10 [Rattus norvegicus]Q9ES66.1 RecName: Full=Calpain-10; AltName: Full=Calcium-activated neutral proteinase 10; Short=CANP 10 [Rattus norvegicus]AAG09736.3 calpain-like protease 10 [Rattus norvegicus]|eukprot:NP_113861.1 calpain-10 [Rattus norvegicus]